MIIRRRIVSIFMAIVVAFSFTMSFSFADDIGEQKGESDEITSEEINVESDVLIETDNTEPEIAGETVQDAEIGQTGGLSLKWSGSDIVLKWHETEGAEGYEVFRSCQSKAEVDFKLLADVESQDFSGYTDFGRNKDYVDIYRVRAYTKDQESGERIYGDYSDKVYSVKIAKRLPVMTYHHLCKAKKFKKIKKYRSLYVKDSDFRAQMNWLKKNGWRTVSTDEVAQWYNNEIELPYKSTLITFDDGCYSVIKYGYKVLKSNNQKATIFMQGNKTHNKTNTRCYKGYKFKTIGKDTMKSIRSDYPALEFQSHTWRMHDRIKKKKPIYKFTQKQIDDDCNNMQQIFGYTAIAYPWGSYNGKIISSLQNNGYYKVGFTYGTNTYATKEQNKFALKRIKVYGGASLKKFTKWFK